jgi:hypothetical protein
MGYVELCLRREGRFLRWCARKRLQEQFRSDLRFRSMFMDEARLAGLVRHPNVVGVSDVGEDADGPYLIMDYVEGVSLSRAIREMVGSGRSIPMQVAVRICLDVAMGLHAAHEVRSEDGTILRLVHRDVSPQNILIGFDGTVRVTDFGIAKALGNTSQTNAGVLKGNMGYLSPEQLQFEEPDRRSDFFSLGVTLYELLSGVRLYPNTDGFDGTRRILVEPPPDIGEVRTDVPPELVELLFEMLSKSRESRPSTALEIAGRLEGILAPLIAEEGSVTVADYMDQHFAHQRHQQRTFLAEHSRRLAAEPPVTLRSLPAEPAVSEGELAAAHARGNRLRSKWLLVGAVAVAAGAAIELRGLFPAGPRGAVTAVGRSTVASLPPLETPSPASEIPTVVPIPSLPSSTPPLAPAARPAGRVAGVHTKTRKRAASRRAQLAAYGKNEKRRPTVDKEQDEHGHLAVPLFTKWR